MRTDEGKIAIITGGGTGIGEAISKKFGREGAKVVVCGFPDDPLEDVAASINVDGGIAAIYKGDISTEFHAKACVAKAVELFGKLDILVNNAGVFSAIEELQNFPDEAFDFLIRNNIYSVYQMTKHALPELQKTKGCIVNAGSESGELGLADNTPYGGTKGFMHAFTKGIAVEPARYGIRANCVCPGPIDTAWTHKETSQLSKKNEKLLVEATAMGRRGTPEEVANVYLFLASDEASYITGSLYMVDGGVTAAKGSIGKMADKSMQKAPDTDFDLDHKKDGVTDYK